MFRSLLSRPAVQRFISRPGAMVLYTPLAVIFAWQAVGFGWHATGAFVCGWLGLFFGLIAFREWDACITGRDFYY